MTTAAEMEQILADAMVATINKAVAKAVAAERARCAAVCREVAVLHGEGGRAERRAHVAEECAFAVERPFLLELSDGADGWVPASAHGMPDQYVTRDAAWDAARAAFCDTEHLSLMCRVVERGAVGT